jgi:signal peptidase II
MANALWENLGMRLIWGPLSPLGLALALLVFGVDQAHKWWMLNIYDIGARGRVSFTPFLDLLLVWNMGISYGLFNNNSQHILVVLSLLVCAVARLILSTRGGVRRAPRSSRDGS